MKKRTVYIGEDVNLKPYWKIIVVLIVLTVFLSPRVKAEEVSPIEATLVVGLDGTYTCSAWPSEVQETAEFNALPQIFDGKLYVSMDVISPLFNTCPCNLWFDANANYIMFYDGTYYYYLQLDSNKLICYNLQTSELEESPMQERCIIFHDEFFIPIASFLNTNFLLERFVYSWDNETKLLNVKYSCPASHIKKLDITWADNFKQILIEKGVIENGKSS